VIVVTNAQSIAKIMPERQAEFLAGLRQAAYAIYATRNDGR
jgi:4'-phosphopantetheinyl transferase EntD